MASATSVAFSRTLSASTTWVTSPHFSAAAAVIGDAVRETSLALLGPMILDSFWESPHDGKIPNLRQTRFEKRS